MTRKPARNKQPLPADRLWTLSDVALYLGLSEKTVTRLPGLVPVHLHASGNAKPIIRWEPEDVRAYAKARRRTGQDEKEKASA